MICVIDTNAAVEIVQEKAGAIDLINRILSADKVLAPTIFLAEAGNVFRKYVQGGFYDEARGFFLFQRAVSVVDEFIDMHILIDEAVHEAMRLNHSVYDLLYLVLARRNGAKLLTLDKKLQELYGFQLV